MDAKALSLAIIKNATDYVGLVETKSNREWDKPSTPWNDTKLNNRLVRLMKLCRWWAPGAAYCAAFDFAVVYESITQLSQALYADIFRNHWTAHCMTNVREMNKLKLLRKTPKPGALWLARHGNTDSGHAGIVTAHDTMRMATVEGNTSSGTRGSQRQGDGIYARVRDLGLNGTLITQGFVWPEDIIALVFGDAKPAARPAKLPGDLVPVMIPVYGALQESGNLKHLQAALGKIPGIPGIPGRIYDKAANLTVAPPANIATWLVTHAKT